MPETAFGLPLHVLVVHLAVVLVPVAGLLAIVIAISQERRRKWGVLTWLLATFALVAVVIAKFSGQSLLDTQFSELTEPVDQHARYGSLSVWFTAAMWLAISAMLLLEIDKRRRSGLGSPILPAVLAVVTILAAMAASGQVVLAAWSGIESHWTDASGGSDA